MKKISKIVLLVLVCFCAVTAAACACKHTDEDADGLCDKCGETYHLDADANCYCDLCEAALHVDSNADCSCDKCGAVVETHVPGENCVCATCGFDFHNDYAYLVANVHNSVCQNCGKSFAKTDVDYSYHDPSTCEHRDYDSNCVCDLCFVGMGHNFGADNKCTVCGLSKRLEGNYTYTTSFLTSPTCWNIHTYQTADDGDVADYLMSGLYGFYFDGSKKGYEIWPEMASAYPEDVTEYVKGLDYNFGIPADATEHYAYKIRLNKNAKWEDGTPIKAADWVESFELLMNPELANYRAADQMSGNVVVANCKEYYYQGQVAITENGLAECYTMEDLTKGDDGQYYTPDGDPMFFAVGYPLADWLGGDTLYDYVSYYGASAFDVTTWDALLEACDEDGLVPLTDENYALFAPVTTNNPAWGESEADLPAYMVYKHEYEDNFSFDKVGMFVDPTDEYAFYMVLKKPAFGFYYIYGLSSWLVKVDDYKAGFSTDEVTGIKTTNYNTSLETTHSFGPYMLSVLQVGKEIDFVRNENWFGYSDSRYDCMYQTSAITEQQVAESSTRKQMFLKGELMSYGLQAADYAEYGNSDYYYVSPGSTLFFMILSANEDVLVDLETPGINKTIICNPDFRHAMSLAFNKGEFSQAISPARAPAYSVIGAYDIWNPNTGENYRNTEIAKKAIVEFFGYELQENGKYKITGSNKEYTLDEANDAINGYSPEVAKELFNKAYADWFADGKIGETDIVEIAYATSEASDFQTKMLNELNRQLERTLTGTALEGRVRFVDSAPYGDEWSEALKHSEAQTCLAGWQGGMMDPFGSMLYYLEPNHKPYAAEWWHTEAETLTLTLPVGEDGADEEITMTLDKWSLCLTGDIVKDSNGIERNFGYCEVADEVRLTILAEFEKTILGTDYYIPFMQDATGFLLSKKVNYVLGREDYNAVLGRGGMAYMTYNYDDAAWAAYVTAQGGTLVY